MQQLCFFNRNSVNLCEKEYCLWCLFLLETAVIYLLVRISHLAKKFTQVRKCHETRSVLRPAIACKENLVQSEFVLLKEDWKSQLKLSFNYAVKQTWITLLWECNLFFSANNNRKNLSSVLFIVLSSSLWDIFLRNPIHPGHGKPQWRRW